MPHLQIVVDQEIAFDGDVDSVQVSESVPNNGHISTVVVCAPIPIGSLTIMPSHKEGS